MTKRFDLRNKNSAPLTRGVDEMDADQRRWFAVRTSARHEKRAARELSRLGIEHYLPLREKTFNYPSKQVTRQLPLLTGYIFVYICKKEEASVYYAPYCSGFVRIGKDRRCVKEEEINILKRISADRELEWTTANDIYAIEEGTPVEVIRGVLAGAKGHFIQQKNKKVFIIRFPGVSLQLSTYQINPEDLAVIEGEPLQNIQTKNKGRREALW